MEASAGIRVVLRTRKGGPIPVEMWTTARLDSLGEYSGALTVARPLAESSRLDGIDDAKRMLDEISDAMQIGISIHSAAYEIIFQNEFLKKNYPGTIGGKCYRTYRGSILPVREMYRQRGHGPRKRRS